MRERRLPQLKQTARASLVTSGQPPLNSFCCWCVVHAFSPSVTVVAQAKWLRLLCRLGPDRCSILHPDIRSRVLAHPLQNLLLLLLLKGGRGWSWAGEERGVGWAHSGSKDHQGAAARQVRIENTWKRGQWQTPSHSGGSPGKALGSMAWSQGMWSPWTWLQGSPPEGHSYLTQAPARCPQASPLGRAYCSLACFW